MKILLVGYSTAVSCWDSVTWCSEHRQVSLPAVSYIRPLNITCSWLLFVCMTSAGKQHQRCLYYWLFLKAECRRAPLDCSRTVKTRQLWSISPPPHTHTHTHTYARTRTRRHAGTHTHTHWNTYTTIFSLHVIKLYSTLELCSFLLLITVYWPCLRVNRS